MRKIKCEYCKRPALADDLECFRCGAPLPLMEGQLEPIRTIAYGGPYEGYSTYTMASTVSTDFYFGQTYGE